MEKTLEQRPSDCIRIVLIGPESTGKTTLANQLATHYGTSCAPEYMRKFLQDKWDLKNEICTRDDLLPIAEGQMRVENEALELAKKLLICDTNLLELKVYAQYYYDGFCPKEIIVATEKNQYDFYFLTDIDVLWEKDDLRDRPYDRSTLFRMFEMELQKKNLPYQVLKGNQDSRLQAAIRAVNLLL